jgi:Fe-S cluster assembly ATP-binding protein
MNVLQIKDLHVSIDNKKILKGINLELELGKVNALMGPNGSGKSTLANVIAGNPNYEITKGEILLDGKVINDLSPDKRAKLGLFLSFQYPQEIEGVTITNFLRTALNANKEEKISVLDFKELIEEKAKLLNLNEDFYSRYLNEGFSGGEKKKSEMLQLLTLDPKLAIMDETDSGLDIDALKSVSNGINKFMDENKSVLIITHYKRILELIRPDKVFIMLNGKIVQTGDYNLVDHLEEKGYGWIEEEPTELQAQ